MPTVGRGGAGNIQILELEAAHNAPGDIEARRRLSDQSIQQAESAQLSEEPLYAHTGRGGAGNYYSPRDLRETGRFVDAQSSHIFGDGTPAPNSQGQGDDNTLNSRLDGPSVQASHIDTSTSGGPTERPLSSASAASSLPAVRTYGRGGAGNLLYGVSESDWRASDKRIAENKLKEDKIKAAIEKDVQQSLPIPEKAKLPAAEV